MNNTAFYAILIVLILGIVYVLKTSDTPPETGMTQTPKEYIEYVERKKAAKRVENEPIKSLNGASENVAPVQVETFNVDK